MADRDGNGFLWFLAGLGVGAVVGVLYAPKSGEETRNMLRSRAQEGGERARHHARRVREQAGEWMDRGGDMIDEQRERLRNAYEASRQAYKRETGVEAEAPKNL